MPITSLSAGQVRRLHLRAQRLDSGRPVHDTAKVVSAVCGLQAQDLPAARLAVRVRSHGLTAADVERARLEERTIVWTWAMRGTLHLVAAEDVRWLVALLGPGLVAANRGRRAQLGLSDEACVRAMAVIREMLATNGPTTRDDVAARLRSHGIRAQGQARAHLMYQAVLEGIACRGPDRDGEPAYVLVDDWLGRAPAPAHEDSLARLAHRYLEAYGPARPEDLAAWSGLGMGDARRAWERIAREIQEVDAGGRPAWLLKRRARWLREVAGGSLPVRLLPRYDALLLGYASRDLILTRAHARRVQAGGGVIHATLLVDGRVRGKWSTRRRGTRLEVIVEPFGPDLDRAARAAVGCEVEDIGRFLDVPVGLATRASSLRAAQGDNPR